MKRMLVPVLLFGTLLLGLWWSTRTSSLVAARVPDSPPATVEEASEAVLEFEPAATEPEPAAGDARIEAQRESAVALGPHGQLLDSAGRPCAGWIEYACIHGPDAASESRLRQVLEYWRDLSNSLETADDGRFELPASCQGSLIVMGWPRHPRGDSAARGESEDCSQLRFFEHSEDELLLRLGALSPIAVRIVDDLGRPLRGAVVLAAADECLGFELVGAGAPAGLRLECTDILLDAPADGRLALTGLAPGNWMISATLGSRGSEPILLDLRVSRPTEPIDLVVERLAEVAGRVWAADGSPAAKARVVLLDGPAGELDALEIDSGMTDARGRFQITGVLPGTYHVLAFGANDAPNTPREFRLLAGQQFVTELSLLPAGALELRLELELEGQAQVEVRSVSRDLRWFDSVHSFPHLIRGLSPGEVEVSVESEGQGSWSRSAEVVEGETHVLDLTPRAAVPIRGRVSWRGAGVGGLQLTALVGREPEVTRVHSRADPEGRFEFELDRLGLVWLSVESSGYSLGRSVELLEGEREPLEIALPDGELGGRVEGDLAESFGRRVQASLQEGEGSCRVEQTLDGEGRFTFRRLPPGSYRVELQASGEHPGAVLEGVLVDAREPTQVVLREGSSGTLLGSLHDPEAPTDDADVWALPLESSMSSRSTTASDGRYRLDFGLGPGSYQLYAARGDRAALSPRLVLGEGGEVACDLTLQAAGQLEVFVQGSGDRMLAGLTLRSAEGADLSLCAWQAQPTGVELVTRFGPLPPGEYELIARKVDFADAHRQLRIRANETERVTIEMQE